MTDKYKLHKPDLHRSIFKSQEMPDLGDLGDTPNLFDWVTSNLDPTHPLVSQMIENVATKGWDAPQAFSFLIMALDAGCALVSAQLLQATMQILEDSDHPAVGMSVRAPGSVSDRCFLHADARLEEGSACPECVDDAVKRMADDDVSEEDARAIISHAIADALQDAATSEQNAPSTDTPQ